MEEGRRATVKVVMEEALRVMHHEKDLTRKDRNQNSEKFLKLEKSR